MNDSPPSQDPELNSETKFKLAFGKTRYGVELAIHGFTFSSLAKFCSEPQQGGKHDAWMLRGGDVQHVESYTTRKGVKHGPGYYRTNEYLLSARLLIIDGDSSIDDPKSAPPPKLVHQALKHFGIKHFLYTSHSHTDKINKFRVVIPCSMSKSQCRPTSLKIIQELNDFGIPIKWVREMGVWAQIWYLPTRDDPTDGLFEFYEYLEGDDYCAVDSFDEPEQPKDTGPGTGTGLKFGDHVAAMYKTGELHSHYAPMCQARANQGRTARQIFDELKPICEAAQETLATNQSLGELVTQLKDMSVAGNAGGGKDEPHPLQAAAEAGDMVAFRKLRAAAEGE